MLSVAILKHQWRESNLSDNICQTLGPNIQKSKLHRVNKVNHCQARLVLGWVTIGRWVNRPSW